MKDLNTLHEYEVGYDIPAKPGMDEAEILGTCPLCGSQTSVERELRPNLRVVHLSY